MVAINVLERHMAAVADSPTGLHGPVGGVAGQTVRAVVTHGNKVRDFHVMFLVEHGCCVPDELAQHCSFGVQFNKWKLNALIHTEFFPPRDSLVRVSHCFVDAILRST